METKNALFSEHCAAESALSRATHAAQETTRLDLLSDIDATIDALAVRARDFREKSEFFSELESDVSSGNITPGRYIDPDFVLVASLESAEDALKAYLPRMTAKRASIDRDSRLSTEHREALHNAYDEAVTEAALLHEAMQAARHAIIGHDMKAEPRAQLQTFGSVEELIANLHGNP
jgi:hypothetical protein